MAAVDLATFTSAGRTTQHVVPGVYSRLDVLAGASGFVSIGNAVLIGSAQGGEPQRLLQFNNQSQALSALKGGPLYDAIRHAFNPAPEPDLRPQRLFVMRVNDAAQSTYQLAAGGNDTINLVSRDWGIDQNQIQLNVIDNPAAPNEGRDITIRYRGVDQVLEAVERPLISIQGGVASTIEINGTEMIFGGAPIAMTIDYTTYDNVGALVSSLTALGFTVSVQGGNDNIPLLEDTFDYVAAATPIVAAVVLTANTREVIERINAESRFVTAVLVSGASPAQAIDVVGTARAPGPPVVAATFDFFSGGNNGDYNATQVAASLTRLEAEDVQIVTTPDPDDVTAAVPSVAGIHMQIQQHCTRMSSTEGRRERQFILGGPWGQTIDESAVAARALNSYLGKFVFNGFTERDALGVLRNWGSSYQACRIAGLASVLSINEPLTFKTLQGSVLEQPLSNANLEVLIKAGVSPVAYSDNGVPHIKRQVNTYQIANKIFNEFSAVREGLFANRDLRNFIETRITGRPGTAVTQGMVRGFVLDRLGAYVGEGIFIGDENNPAFSNISVELDGDVYTIDYDANLTLPVNFGFITSHFRVFASASQA